eukprot:7250449-Pyramimonas_sp.AAC.1
MDESSPSQLNEPFAHWRGNSIKIMGQGLGHTHRYQPDVSTGEEEEEYAAPGGGWARCEHHDEQLGPGAPRPCRRVSTTV